MPDYTYHPALKPLLFRLPVEESRRLTLRLLEIQARTALGRRIFRIFGHGLPPERLRIKVFGIDFPGPIGLGPGIDIEGTTIQVMQYLGFGWITLGPAGDVEVPRSFSTDPIRIPVCHGLVQSEDAAAPSCAELAHRIALAADLKIPSGIALRGDNLDRAIADAHDHAAFFTLPSECVNHSNGLRALRAITQRPLLLRIDPDWTEIQLDAACASGVEFGLNGCVAVAGSRSDLLPNGRADGPFMTRRALAIVERIAKRHGDAFPIAASGGIMSPGDAMAMLDAGAKLVELSSGLVYAGPGLPGRIVHALEHRLNSKHRMEHGPQSRTETKPQNVGEPRTAGMGWALVAFTGFVLFASGVFALILAATVKLLPYDVAYLGMSMKDLCDRNQCRVVHFMAHDRVAFGGSIMSIGTIYGWLACVPLRRGEAWSWWTLLISGVAGFASFLTYLGYGYFDLWHGWATLALLIFFVSGMILSFRQLDGSRHPRALFQAGASAWLYSPAGRGRALLMFAAAGMILGGAIIMAVGMTTIFVPQDLEYMQLTVSELNAINPRLVPLIAHDRAGFGGGLCSGGLAILCSAWCGLRPGARGLWWTFLFAGLFGFGTAIGVHPIVGYNSFIHLLPAYIGALAFLTGMWLLWKPVLRADNSGNSFPDL